MARKHRLLLCSCASSYPHTTMVLNSSNAASAINPHGHCKPRTELLGRSTGCSTTKIHTTHSTRQPTTLARFLLPSSVNSSEGVLPYLKVNFLVLRGLAAAAPPGLSFPLSAPALPVNRSNATSQHSVMRVPPKVNVLEFSFSTFSITATPSSSLILPARTG